MRYGQSNKIKSYNKIMKKMLRLLIVTMLLVACNYGQLDTENQIKVYTRDSSSGTRQAFESIIGLNSILSESAETSGNGDMAAQVGDNLNAIGYVSLTTDFNANNLKPLLYEGVKASVSSVIAGDYKLSRSFAFVTRAQGDFQSDKHEELVRALLDYMQNSQEGREFILAAGGIVDVKSGESWDKLKIKHPIVNQDNSDLTIKTGGSTSVNKTLSKVIASFIPMAGNFKYEPNHTGSADGYKRTLGSEKDGANMIDIGFASRDFTINEDLSTAMLKGIYTKDAIVVVVNKNNIKVNDLNASELKKVFSGFITKWDQIN